MKSFTFTRSNGTTFVQMDRESVLVDTVDDGCPSFVVFKTSKISAVRTAETKDGKSMHVLVDSSTVEIVKNSFQIYEFEGLKAMFVEAVQKRKEDWTLAR